MTSPLIFGSVNVAIGERYTNVLLEHDRKVNAFHRICSGGVDRVDAYNVSMDASWCLMFDPTFIDGTLRTLAVQLINHCSTLMLPIVTLSEDEVKCWLCKKTAIYTSEHLSMIPMDHLKNGFIGATDSYFITMKHHGAEDPCRYLPEITISPGYGVYYKVIQKLTHKYAIMTNGIPTIKDINRVAYTPLQIAIQGMDESPYEGK